MAETAKAPEPESTDEPSVAVSLSTRYEVVHGQPLPAFDSPHTRAFAARHVRDPKDDVYALVCQTELPPRLDVLQATRHLQHPALLDVYDWGPIDWPADRRRRFAIIMERPGGRRLMRSLDETRDPMSPDQVTRNVIMPVLSALKDLRARGVHHGSIRPTNMFQLDITVGAVVLGECAATPPGYTQPAMFEPIERALANPAGRGKGDTADDLFALGVTTLFLLMGRNPAGQLDEAAIMARRIERGSYAALTDEARVPPQMLEPLRGLLVDEPRQRWNLDDLELWLSGRRQSPKQAQPPKNATRPLQFAGQNLWHPRSLAAALAREPRLAASLFEGEEVPRWLRRGLSDTARAEAVEAAVASASETGRANAYEDRLVTRVCIGLDPIAPIRYRSMATLPEGYGGMLAEMFVSGASPQPFAEIVLSQFAIFWVNMQPEARPELGGVVSMQESLRGHLEKPAPGQGIERCLYELNPGMTCLSPAVVAHYPMSPRDLLIALEDAAKSKDRPRDPIDRHICAWLVVQDRRLDPRLLRETVSNPDAVRRAAAILAVYADIQHRFGPPSLPHLCRWVSTFLTPAFTRFYNLKTREALKGELEKTVEAGNLGRLLKLIDDPAELRKDIIGFRRAKKMWRLAKEEIERLETDRDRSSGTIQALGRQAAAVLAGCLGAAAVVGLLVMRTG